jgi:Protein of unknown function (DUF3489)
MIRLSDTHLVILSAAAQRDDLSVLPLPDSLTLKGGAFNKVLRSLKAKGLIDHQGAARGDDPPPLRITRAGLLAIGVETKDEAPEGAARADTARPPVEAGVQADEGPAHGTDAETAATPAKSKAKAKATKRGKAAPAKGKAAPAKGKARVTKAASADRPNPRAGTKQAQMIELLRRPEGATVEQIAAVTGWQHHTICGAISGALKKKLGLTIQATRTREVGPNKTGAKGSSTTYRIVT